MFIWDLMTHPTSPTVTQIGADRITLPSAWVTFAKK